MGFQTQFTYKFIEPVKVSSVLATTRFPLHCGFIVSHFAAQIASSPTCILQVSLGGDGPDNAARVNQELQKQSLLNVLPFGRGAMK